MYGFTALSTQRGHLSPVYITMALDKYTTIQVRESHIQYNSLLLPLEVEAVLRVKKTSENS